MQIDELRGELATLADEMEPFEGDVHALHRRDRRGRVITAALTAALVCIVVVSVAAAILNHSSGGVRIAGIPSKEVGPDKISHIDAFVVPATPAVQEALDASPLVGQYARIPHADRSTGANMFTGAEGKRALCALQSADGYAVDAVAPDADFAAGLRRALGGRATVYVADQFNHDMEIFLSVDVSAPRTASIRAALQSDPDLVSMQYVSRTDAYAIFGRDFAQQPALVERTKPSDLPESFRIIVKPGRSVSAVVARYAHRPGVDTIITPANAAIFDPASIIRPSGKLVSPCDGP